MTSPFWIGPVFAGRLGVMPRPRGHLWLDDEISALRVAGVDVLASMLCDDEIAEFGLEAEGSECAARGIEFLRFPITDHSVPPLNDDTAAFVGTLADRLRAGQSVVTHCFAGIGRSVLIAASAMSLAGLPPEEIFAAISRARGWIVPDTEEQRQWVIAFAERHARRAPIGEAREGT